MKSPDFLTSRGVDLQNSLELFGDIETYNDTVGDFIVGAAGKVEKLKTYMAAKDLANYAIYVHSVKSDAKYFGFTKLADKAYEHELKSKSGDLYYIYENFNDLVKEVNESIAIVKEYLSGVPETPIQNTSVEQPTQVVESTIVNQPEIVTTPTNNNAAPKIEEYNDKTILVVDDSNIIRNFVKKLFDGQYLVGTAKNGQEAIDIMEANKNNEYIVAVLLDLNMPKVDGFEVLKYMEENDLFEKNPVSIITGDSSKETIDKAYKYPIVDMLGKPFNESDVKRVVEKTILYKEMS